jgi:apolipoprotein N-acyltransferase
VLSYLKSREGATRAGLAIVTGALIALALPRFEVWPLIWVSFVPLLIAVRNARPLETWLLGTLAGTVFQLIACHWLGYMAEKFMGAAPPLSWGVALAISAYAGQTVALTILLYRLAQRATGWPAFALLPLAGVIVWPVFPNLFFVTLGTGTIGAPFTMQAVEVFGPYGLDAVILLASAGVFEALQRPRARARQIGVVVALAVVIAWWSYGLVALSSWDARVASWSHKRVGLVQPNRASAFRQLPPEPGYTRDFPLEMEMTQQLAQRGADLVVWPEGHLYGTMWRESRERAFRQHVANSGVDVILHDKGPDPRLGPKAGRKKQRNSAVFFPKDGGEPSHYHKRVLIPFGEYYPLVGYSPFWRKALDLRVSLWPGTEPHTFDAGGMKLEPLICYEILFGRHAARSVGRDDPTGKVILVQSNDGWYGPGSAPSHHRAATMLRAVENRVPVIHALNSGESHVVAPSGRMLFQAPDWQRGKWIVEMPYDASSGGSFYSRAAGWFVWTARVLVLAGVAALLVRRRRLGAAA